jgi:hypothetical protein
VANHRMLVSVPASSAPMSLHFDDADPVAECHVKNCEWHVHGDSIMDAVTSWVGHLTDKHKEDWE